jgi:hypothetical protein
MISTSAPDLWTLALDRQWIDATELAAALEHEAVKAPSDFRTRLLIRDSLNALGKFWGQRRLAQWMTDSPARGLFETITGGLAKGDSLRGRLAKGETR